jgi:hypothetical protein
MSATISSLIHRCRRHIPRLLPADDCLPFILPADEEALGLYKNEAGDDVLFTTKGLRVGERPLLPYLYIEDARVVESGGAASQIELRLAGGGISQVEFDGGNERFRDIWEMVRLLDRIVSITNRNP